MTRVYLFLDRLNFAESVLALAIVGLTCFIALGLLQLGALHMASLYRRRRAFQRFSRLMDREANRNRERLFKAIATMGTRH